MIEDPLWHGTGKEVQVERQRTAVWQYAWHLGRIHIAIHHHAILVLAGYRIALA